MFVLMVPQRDLKGCLVCVGSDLFDFEASKVRLMVQMSTGQCKMEPMAKRKLDKQIAKGLNRLSVMKIFCSGLDEQMALRGKGKFADRHANRLSRAVIGLEEILDNIVKEYGGVPPTEVGREVHKGRNQLSCAKMFVTCIKEEETVTGKGEFARSNKEMLYRSIDGLEKTLRRILDGYGEQKKVPARG
jgi:hypothetical protein